MAQKHEYLMSIRFVSEHFLTDGERAALLKDFTDEFCGVDEVEGAVMYVAHRVIE